MAGTELLSLLQISDLHFGVPAAHTAPPPAHWRHLALCDGWLGHDLRAIQHLSDFVVDPAHQHAAEHMVISGDMTSCGKDVEFDTATQYVQTSIKVGANRAGLHHKTVLDRSIPGNHDHWPGSLRVVGTASKQLGVMFRTMPFTPYVIPLANGKTLRVAGINSDRDVWKWGVNRAFARGQFITELQALQQSLGARGKDEIRVLLVHHSPSWTGTKLGIDDNSSRALWAFVEQYGISVLMTGHIHIPIGRIQQVAYGGVSWEVLEARCGTTTQTDQMPIGWAAKGMGNASRFPRNSLLVHRLVDHGSRIDWEVDLYWRRESGFDRREALTRAITVWPR